QQAMIDSIQQDSDPTIVGFTLPIAVADSGSLYITDISIESETPNQLRASMSFGNAHMQPFPVTQWVVQIVNADSLEMYANLVEPAVYVDGLMTRVEFNIDLPATIPTNI